MQHKNSELAGLLQTLDIGSSIAELDALLEVARVETSAFTDLLSDRVDLIPGTKGSGKSALFRIIVDFLPKMLLENRKVVVAHGVQSPGDPVFHAFSDEFSKLDEQQFISFWCIYLVSLAHEQFIKGAAYTEYLKEAEKEIENFRRVCALAKIPEIKAKKSLKDILQWTLNVLASWHPKVTYKSPDKSGDLEFDLFGGPIAQKTNADTSGKKNDLPHYVGDIKEALDAVLSKSQLSLWLMIDRLDEIFPRRSELERTALRGLLRSMRFFSSSSIRVKVFLRDDMLDQVVRGNEGFTALTHITARQADTLRWTEEQILSMVVKRIFANDDIKTYFKINKVRLDANAEYRSTAFYKVFPPTVHGGEKQSSTLRWIFSRSSDGRGVVTPRDVIDLLSRAKQKQQDELGSNADGTSEWLIGPAALHYGLQQLSIKKRQTYLQAEFPHLWKNIERFIGGKTEYDEGALVELFHKDWKGIAEDLSSIGFFKKSTTRDGRSVFWIPYLYRHGLELTQGKA